ncbi:hypothetical protein [Endozoicomonas sp. SCSIO W0465]|nr:hypothetical protein [Endozoicomonas sp. SCSIO W0465]
MNNSSEITPAEFPDCPGDLVRDTLLMDFATAPAMNQYKAFSVLF